MISWGDAHARAAVAASELHADLGIDLTTPSTCSTRLSASPSCSASRPWNKVSGLYLPKMPGQPSAGILLHSGHPRTRQRYTAGHELGHHAFGHAAEVDLDIEQALRRGDCHTRRPALV